MPTQCCDKPELSLEEQNTNFAHSPEWETNEAISSIMDIAMKPLNFVQQLREILAVLVSISWLKMEEKGAIFVTNNQQELVLIAEHSLHQQLKKSCAKVAMGQCLCGKAAAAKSILFRSCVDHDHETSFEGMEDHGHYCVPLLDNRSTVIGLVVLYLQAGHKPHPKEQQLMAMLGRTISAIILNRSYQLRAEISRIRLQHAQQDILHKLVVASEFKDNETGEHIKRVSLYAAAIGRELGLSDDQVQLLEQAAPLHDIGKIGIPDDILLKPSGLTPDERTAMEQHTVIGADLLKGTHALIEASREIALTHHEKWDGTGYPQGLKGEGIPLFGRICALADVFDALSHKRPYKEAWSLDETLAQIDLGTGTHFDPRVVAAFKARLPEILDIKGLYSNSRDNHNMHLPDHVLATGQSSLWKDSMSVGVHHIDAQHMYLINLIDQARESIENFRTRAIVTTLLDMKSYAEIHFADEEKLMAQHGFPGLAAHTILHNAFIKKAETFLDGLEAAPLATTSEITGYLTEWLYTHIMVQDAKYGDFIREKEVSDQLATDRTHQP